jgi:hypothetical protein
MEPPGGLGGDIREGGTAVAVCGNQLGNVAEEAGTRQSFGGSCGGRTSSIAVGGVAKWDDSGKAGDTEDVRLEDVDVAEQRRILDQLAASRRAQPQLVAQPSGARARQWQGQGHELGTAGGPRKVPERSAKGAAGRGAGRRGHAKQLSITAMFKQP